MMLPRRKAAWLAVAMLAGLPAAAAAQGAAPKEPLSDTEQAIVDALTRTMELLSRTFDQVMIYEVPELLPNGDILIRRKHPKPDRPKEMLPAPDDDKVKL